MDAAALASGALLPETELARLARVLARFLTGRQPTAAGTQVAGRRAGQGLDFLDFRAYQAGDDSRSIDWRASARSDSVQVRRYCGEVASDWFLCVDASASMGFAGGRKWQQARRLAAAFAYVQLYLGHRVALLLFSDGVDGLCPLGRGHAQYAKILAALAGHVPRITGGGSDIGSCRVLVGQTSPVLVVSDLLAEDAMIPALTQLLTRQRELHLLQLTDPRDLQLPDGGYQLLQDVETGGREHCHADTGAPSRAGERLAMLQRALSEWSGRYRVAYSACGQDVHWRDVLLRHFMAG